MKNLIFEKELNKLSCDEFDAAESPIDTEYFGINSAVVVLKKSCLTTQNRSHLLSFLQDFEFVTINNKGNNPYNNRWLGDETKAFLTDMNMQLYKKITINEFFLQNHSTSIQDNFPKNDRIIQIAENSFEFSRFLNDPYLPQEKSRRIYGDITKNAFEKAGRYFITSTLDEIISGFLLFSLDVSDSSARIELIAVDQNFDFKNRGIGKTLIRSMELFISKLEDINTIRVGTQLSNIDALNFYTSYGFRYSNFNSIYHYWPRNQDTGKIKPKK